MRLVAYRDCVRSPRGRVHRQRLRGTRFWGPRDQAVFLPPARLPLVRPGGTLVDFCAGHHNFDIANCFRSRALVWQPPRFSVVLSEGCLVTLNSVTLRLKVATLRVKAPFC